VADYEEIKSRLLRAEKYLAYLGLSIDKPIIAGVDTQPFRRLGHKFVYNLLVDRFGENDVSFEGKKVFLRGKQVRSATLTCSPKQWILSRCKPGDIALLISACGNIAFEITSDDLSSKGSVVVQKDGIKHSQCVKRDMLK